MKQPRPIYGTIAYFGGWSVVFAPHGNVSHSSLSGYGAFPRDRFPGLPVVDFRTLDGPGLPDAPFPNLPMVSECYGHQIGTGYAPLADYLAQAERAGLIVFRA